MNQLTLIDELLLDQQALTAVERFSQRHAEVSSPIQERFYKELIPLSAPKPGEQYGFEVDLEACSGCKACVSACNHLNGLDPEESWRDVGVLVGERQGVATQQVVTTACHHCSDPACANGCPTLAYEKDAKTGIVRHLDDQCMGCRYCELKCPYEVPKYNDRLGIVRKCDKCQSRLAEGEAPACVQACPNQAIRIRMVPQEGPDVGERLLPGTVDSRYTKPTTVYTHLDTSANQVPADADRLRPAHGHFPARRFRGSSCAGLKRDLRRARSCWQCLAFRSTESGMACLPRLAALLVESRDHRFQSVDRCIDRISRLGLVRHSCCDHAIARSECGCSRRCWADCVGQCVCGHSPTVLAPFIYAG